MKKPQFKTLAKRKIEPPAPVNNSEVSQAQEAASQHIEKHITRRLKNLESVRRFVLSWLALLVIFGLALAIQTRALDQYYLEEIPVSGGTYIEGVAGEVNNINPVFAQSAPEKSIADLVFNGLFRYDVNGQLVPDLVDEWELNEDKDIYTFKLKRNVSWHDGEPFRAQDVVFTYELIKHPDTRSPLNSSWQEVNIQAKDDYTVTFTLPNPFTPFLHSLTNGIVPAHLLSDTPPLQMRSSEFNVNPVGTGIFEFSQVVVNEADETRNRVELVKNESYFSEQAQLDEFIIESFTDREALQTAFEKGELTGASGLQKTEVDQIEIEHSQIDNPTSNGVFLFINNDKAPLKDKLLRGNLVRMTNRTKINDLLGASSSQINSPLLQSQLKHDDKLQQFNFDLGAAEQSLEKSKWQLNDQSVRQKGEQKLEFTLVTQDSPELVLVANEIKRQWAQAGVVVNVREVSAEILQQSHVIPHNYDLLLFGVALGADPDVFVYWHSSQAGAGGFNFSEYKSDEVDIALESGRTRVDEDIRRAKYEAFLENWRNDAPAVALYQDNSAYITIPSVKGLESVKLHDPTDRYATVANWTLNTDVADKVR